MKRLSLLLGLASGLLLPLQRSAHAADKLNGPHGGCADENSHYVDDPSNPDGFRCDCDDGYVGVSDPTAWGNARCVPIGSGYQSGVPGPFPGPGSGPGGGGSVPPDNSHRDRCKPDDTPANDQCRACMDEAADEFNDNKGLASDHFNDCKRNGWQAASDYCNAAYNYTIDDVSFLDFPVYIDRCTADHAHCSHPGGFQTGPCYPDWQCYADMARAKTADARSSCAQGILNGDANRLREFKISASAQNLGIDFTFIVNEGINEGCYDAENKELEGDQQTRNDEERQCIKNSTGGGGSGSTSAGSGGGSK